MIPAGGKNIQAFEAKIKRNRLAGGILFRRQFQYPLVGYREEFPRMGIINGDSRIADGGFV
jgi:hypothetical protein